MSRSLILSFNSAVAKYSRLTKKVNKSISKGEFWRYTRKKRHHLLSRIERLRRRISELRTQAKLAGVGIAVGLLMMSAGEVSAQKSPLGPFVANPAANPFPRPAFDNFPNPVVSFFDMDQDGDLDAAVSSSYEGHNYPAYYLNTGTTQRPTFEPYYNNGVYWFSGAGKARVVYVDIDDDGDVDAVVGMDTSDGGPNDVQDDVLYFFRNLANLPTDPPVFQYDGSNPFAGISIKREGWPAFGDYDNDGDLDLVVGGEYDDSHTEKTAWLQFFRNDKPDHTPGVDVTYTQLQGPTENPLYIGESPAAGFYDLAFADLDGDGDEDSFAIDQHGQVLYRRNDGGGVFVEQDQDYVYQAGGNSTGNPLNIDGLFLATPDSYKSLAFGDLDGDGDTDLVIGNNNIGTLNPQYLYVENTGNGVMVVNRSHSNPISGFSMGRHTNAAFFDYDKDGDNDFLSTGWIKEPIGSEGEMKDVISHLFFENKNGKFEPKTLIDDPFAQLVKDGTDGRWIAADADGDSDVDALFIHSAYDPDVHQDINIVDYYRNDAGTFVLVDPAESPFKPINDLAFFTLLLDVGDVNADGLPDVIAMGDSNIPRFFQNSGEVGSPVFAENAAWQNGLVTVTNLNPKLVDVDGDGDTDLVLGKYFYIWYYENVGTPTTPKWNEYREQPNESSKNQENPFGRLLITDGGDIYPDVADVDGDGDKDLMVAKQDSGAFIYFENQNPAPVVTPGELKDLPWLINQPVDLDPEITIADPDGDNIVKITVAISPFDKGFEKLQVPAASSYPQLDISFDDTKGVLTISGSAPLTDFQDALQDVQYLYSGPDTGGRKKSDAGRTIAKTVTVTTLDADQTIGASNTSTYNIGHTNVAPVISPASFNSSFTTTAVPVFPSIALSDSDDTTLASATVSLDVISYKPAEDRLQMTATGSIAAVFNQATGVLTLTGPGTIADYQTALQSVVYNNLLGASATSGIRILSVKVNDGESDSNMGTTQLSVNGGVNTPPTISGGTVSPFYVNGDLVINNTVVVNDVDGVLVGATVSIASGFASAEDVLVFANQNGITGSYSNTTGVLTLSGVTSVANYQAALRSVQYRNTATEANTADRAITFAVSDGGTPVSLTGTVITINKPPVIKTATKKGAASDGNIAFPVSALTDPDNNIDLSTLSVTSELGQVTVAGGIITVDYSARQANTKGTDHVTISVCDKGGRCKTQNIEVELGAAAIIYTGMSPNGDGINDWFIIENLPPNSHVAIYDRWGDAIFETENYDLTEPSQRFEGKNKNGVDVVAGSYYYKIKFSDDNGVKTGFIILNR
jgi:gliding motility-associated-like protein